MRDDLTGHGFRITPVADSANVGLAIFSPLASTRYP